MIIINQTGNVNSTSDVKKKRRVGEAGVFSALLDAASANETPHTAAPSDIASKAALTDLLALQEMSEYDVERKKLLGRGKNLLDSLDNIRQQILMGSVPLHMLQNLSHQLSAQKQTLSDPKLVEIIEDIELRAAVELAKLEMATKLSG